MKTWQIYAGVVMSNISFNFIHNLSKTEYLSSFSQETFTPG